jgi:hypothetical protein
VEDLSIVQVIVSYPGYLGACEMRQIFVGILP